MSKQRSTFVALLLVMVMLAAAAIAGAQDAPPGGTITLDTESVTSDDPQIPLTITLNNLEAVEQAIFQFDDTEPQPLQLNETLEVEVNAYAFAPGEHTAALTITGTDGETETITETFTVPELPPLLELRDVVNNNQQSQSITADVLLQPGQAITELSYQVNGETYNVSERFAALTAPPAPAPEVGTTNFCEDVSEDVGVGEPATEPMFFDAPEQVIDAEANDYYACIVTDKGIIELTLFDDNAPESVNNFVFLSQQDFYDGTTFHRVVEEFVIQGGDRNAPAEGQPAGTGSPGYMWSLEPGATSLPHETGTLAMARAQSPDSNGSQFYITLAPQPNLDGQYNVFGQVSGENDMEIVQSIEQGDLTRAVEIIEVAADDS